MRDAEALQLVVQSCVEEGALARLVHDQLAGDGSHLVDDRVARLAGDENAAAGSVEDGCRWRGSE